MSPELRTQLLDKLEAAARTSPDGWATLTEVCVAWVPDSKRVYRSALRRFVYAFRRDGARRILDPKRILRGLQATAETGHIETGARRIDMGSYSESIPVFRVSDFGARWLAQTRSQATDLDSVSDDLASEEITENGTSLPRRCAQVLAVLRGWGRPMRLRELMDTCDVSRSTANRTIKKLLDMQLINEVTVYDGVSGRPPRAFSPVERDVAPTQPLRVPRHTMHQAMRGVA